MLNYAVLANIRFSVRTRTQMQYSLLHACMYMTHILPLNLSLYQRTLISYYTVRCGIF
jgi:hypothetical protein